MPVLLVLLSAALFGTTGTAQALGLADVDAAQTGAARLAVGGTALGLIALVPVLRGRGPRRPGRPRLRHLLAVLLAATGVVTYQPAFFTGVRDNGVAVGTLVALGSAPVFTGLLGWALTRRSPEPRWFGCTALAVVGVVLLSGLFEGGGAATVSLPAIAASLGAGLSYAVYTLAVKQLLDAGWTTVAAVGAVFGVAGIVGMIQLALFPAALPIADPRAVAAVLWLGLATIVLAYLLFARGLERLPAATVSTLTLAEPLVAGALGVVVLHERLSPFALVGAVVLVVALGLLGVRRRVRTVAVMP